VRGRPRMVTSYTEAMSIFRTGTTRFWFVVLLVVAFAAPFWLSNDLELLFVASFAYAIGAIGLNLVTGYAGQISLGHAFFLAVGAYTGAVISSTGRGGVYGFGFTEVLIWLPLAGLAAALAGLIVGPIATRLRGLYLAIVTLGLVFVGEHILRNWTSLTGGIGFGRAAPAGTLLGFDLKASGQVLGIEMPANTRLYWFTLVCLIVLAFAAKNLVRSRHGRAFAAVRDRDIAAEIMGVNLTRTKLIAFAVSSFYAGIAGALLGLRIANIEPTNYNLLLSILFIAMVLIGGGASIAGSIIGGLVIGLLPRFSEPLTDLLTPVLNLLLFWRTSDNFPLDEFELRTMVYGAALIFFLLVEPRGIYGLWIRVRNYWKAFPFSY
jgi:branched-chain amino acid transport system permease protein